MPLTCPYLLYYKRIANSGPLGEPSPTRTSQWSTLLALEPLYSAGESETRPSWYTVSTELIQLHTPIAMLFTRIFQFPDLATSAASFPSNTFGWLGPRNSSINSGLRTVGSTPELIWVARAPKYNALLWNQCHHFLVFCLYKLVYALWFIL